jgi:cysteine synthase
MPDDAAVEKQLEVEARGAIVERVRPVAISHPHHMVHQARKAASATQHEGATITTTDSNNSTASSGFFADQFENLDNMDAHIETGEEIWRQCGGRVDAFVCGAGTGGTIAGVSQALKERKQAIQIVLADPPGSSLFLKVCFVSQEQAHRIADHAAIEPCI